MKETIKSWLNMDSGKLPYEHVCQIGDPVLRGHTMMIDPETIKLQDFQKIKMQPVALTPYKKLINIMFNGATRYDCDLHICCQSHHSE
ncbi:PREDICTED: uncharacterized protein LOC106751249 isoform X2 [Dinoponera quadriceps]|nr:PREDICTED: uncharacterized protein LOC106751249 isoform X2 [Dinoponera quadriceps]XP_014487592.1 PREDICTED: uncharacterized protein LOC106751249 isoform X2 [Dinoponera quadriceps]